MRNRTLHWQVRVVYRALRRIYGMEKTQDEALRIFKVVFPQEYKLRNGMYQQSVPESVQQQIEDIFVEWNPTGELHNLCENIINIMGHQFASPEKLIEFYQDITPVAMRIRKLTPSECFTLMGVDYQDIRKIQSSGISKSAQYKCAGNSIVVDVLYYLMKKMFVDQDIDLRKGEAMQLTFDF